MIGLKIGFIDSDKIVVGQIRVQNSFAIFIRNHGKTIIARRFYRRFLVAGGGDTNIGFTEG